MFPVDSNWTVDYFRNRDGRHLRTAFLRACGQPRANILFVPGFNMATEDYQEPLEELAAFDCNIYSLNPVNQGGSELLLADPRRPHHSIGVDRDGRDLLDYASDRITDEGVPTVVFGHSNGALISLTAVAMDKDNRIDAGINAAPFLRFKEDLVRKNADMIKRLPFPRRLREHFALGETGYIPQSDPRAKFKSSAYTGDPERAKRRDRLRAEDPSLRVGGATYGFVKETVRAQSRLLSPGVLEGLSLPMLSFVPARDEIVDQTAMMTELPRIPGNKIVVLDGAHELLLESDRIYRPLMDQTKKFIETLPRPA